MSGADAARLLRMSGDLAEQARTEPDPDRRALLVARAVALVAVLLAEVRVDG